MTVSPDGRQLYVASGICVNQGGVCGASPNSFGTAFWLVDLTTRTVTAANIPPGSGFGAYVPAVGDIAVAPNGLAFYTKSDQDYILGSCTLSIYAAGDISHFSNIDPASSGGGDLGLAISPDSKRVYIGCDNPESIFIIDTSTKTIVNTIPSRPGVFYSGIAVTPDGNHLYAAGGNVAVIDTASNATVATVATGGPSDGLAVTPDGARVYVTNPTKNTVSVIDTASNAVVATIPVPNPSRIEIVTPPQGTPFLALRAGLDVNLGHDPGNGRFQFNSSFVLSSTASNGIHPDTEPVKLQVGPFIATIPAGSFKAHGDRFGRFYSYEGDIDGVSLKVKIAQTGTLRYSVQVEAQGAHLSGIANPVQVSLGIGDDAGLTSLTAHFGGSRTAA